MADVNVNIRGRDEGLGSQLDSLREKAASLGREVTNLNKMSDMTPTQQKLTVEKESESTLRAQQSQISSEHSKIRESNVREFSESRKKFESGDMSQEDFSKSQKTFKEAQGESASSEKKELLEAEKEMNRHLRLIVREMVDGRKINREKAQRDRKEFGEGASGGLLGGMVSENRQLKKEKLSAKTAEEAQELEERIQSNKDRMQEIEGGGKDGKEGGGWSSGEIVGLGQAISQANIQSAGMRGLSGGGKMMGAAKTGAAAAGIFAIAYGLISAGDKVMESSQGVGAMRGRGFTSTQSAALARDEALTGGGGMGGSIGLTPDQVLQEANKKGKASGVVGTDIMRRTMEDITFQRAFGEDAGQFSQFERFTTSQEESARIGLDVLNVLTSIDESSLKEGDLATLGEKLQTQTTLMGIQRTKRDLVDTDSSLRMMAAWESIGLSQKGDKSGDFLSQTISGLGEGGGDNLMLLKYEAAKQAHPELQNDPAALRRFVKFNNDDPAYMNQFFKMTGKMTRDNQMAQDDMLYSFFNPQSEYDMTLYERAMKDGDFSGFLTGEKGIQKKRKGTLSTGYAQQESESMSGGLKSLISTVMAEVGNVGVQLQEFFGDGEGNLNVSVNKTKYGNLGVSKTTKGVRPKKGSK